MRFRGQGPDWNPGENHLARVRRFEQAEQAKQHMLSAARSAQHHVKASRLEGDGDVAQRRVFVSDARDSAKFQGG